jgi:hypothetical protein
VTPPRFAFERGGVPELGGDNDLPAERSQGLAHQLFVGERAVHLRGVEEREAALDGRANEGNHLLLVWERSVAVAHPHAAEPDRRDFQVTVAECAFLHSFSFRSEARV